MSALLPVYQRDMVVVSGKGATVTDSDGRQYLDFAAGIGVNGLGYGDPKVVAAIRKQAGRLIHASNLYHSEVTSSAGGAAGVPGLPVPRLLLQLRHGGRGGRHQVRPAHRRRAGPHGAGGLRGVVPRPHAGRPLPHLEGEVPRALRAAPARRALLPWNDLTAARANIGPRTAAVFVEPVQGEGGIRVAPPDFLQGLRDICRDSGALLVSEEVQCGLGRTGRLFAYQHTGVRPDILTLAKPLGGGLPLGAVLLREDLASAIQVGDHGSTFGGNPVAAAAALAVLDRLTSEEPPGEGGVEGALPEARPGRPGPQAPGRDPGHPRRRAHDRRGARGPRGGVVRGLRERGILATKAGDNVLRLLPPLVVKRREIQRFLTALDEVLATGAGRQPIEGGGGAAA